MQRRTVQIDGPRPGECGAQEWLEAQPERDEVDEQRIADVDDVVALLVEH